MASKTTSETKTSETKTSGFTDWAMVPFDAPPEEAAAAAQLMAAAAETAKAVGTGLATDAQKATIRGLQKAVWNIQEKIHDKRTPEAEKKAEVAKLPAAFKALETEQKKYACPYGNACTNPGCNYVHTGEFMTMVKAIHALPARELAVDIPDWGTVAKFLSKTTQDGNAMLTLLVNGLSADEKLLLEASIQTILAYIRVNNAIPFIGPVLQQKLLHAKFVEMLTKKKGPQGQRTKGDNLVFIGGLFIEWLHARAEAALEREKQNTAKEEARSRAAAMRAAAAAKTATAAAAKTPDAAAKPAAKTADAAAAATPKQQPKQQPKQPNV